MEHQLDRPATEPERTWRFGQDGLGNATPIDLGGTSPYRQGIDVSGGAASQDYTPTVAFEPDVRPGIDGGYP